MEVLSDEILREDCQHARHTRASANALYTRPYSSHIVLPHPTKSYYTHVNRAVVTAESAFHNTPARGVQITLFKEAKLPIGRGPNGADAATSLVDVPT